MLLSTITIGETFLQDNLKILFKILKECLLCVLHAKCMKLNCDALKISL